MENKPIGLTNDITDECIQRIEEIPPQKSQHDQPVLTDYQIHKTNSLYDSMDIDKWAEALASEEERKEILPALISIVAKSQDMDKISTTLRAFMFAELPEELILLLEAILFNNELLSSQRNLQNLLILTAIKIRPEKVMSYLTV